MQAESICTSSALREQTEFLSAENTKPAMMQGQEIFTEVKLWEQAKMKTVQQ